MKLIIGSDHAGFELKEYIIEHLKSCGHQVLDTGCYNKNSCDYPDIAKFVCRKFIIKGDFTFWHTCLWYWYWYVDVRQ